MKTSKNFIQVEIETPEIEIIDNEECPVHMFFHFEIPQQYLDDNYSDWDVFNSAENLLDSALVNIVFDYKSVSKPKTESRLVLLNWESHLNKVNDEYYHLFEEFIQEEYEDEI